MDQSFKDDLEFLMGAPGWKPVVLPDGSWYFKHIKSEVTALYPGGPFCNKERPHGDITT